MLHLFNLLLIGLVLLNVTGLTLLLRRRLGLPYGLAQATAILGLCLASFFVEHHVGLGALPRWLMPLAALVCAGVGWRRRAELWTHRGAWGWFLVGFGYALSWRYLHPNLDASSEKLADLSFVADYMAGVTLPPPDVWYPPFRLEGYYSFQHYGAGLLGRTFYLPPGTAYHVSFCLVAGLALSAAYEVVRPLCRGSRWGQALVLAAFLVGGTGACVLTPFMVNDSWHRETPWQSMRFAGSTTFMDDGQLTGFGRWVKALGTPAGARREQVQDLPMETFSYVTQLGDYHAPLGGFLLLAWSLGLAAVLRDDPRHRVAGACLGASLPLTVAVNTWVLPLQVALVAGVFLLLSLRGRGSPGTQPPWTALVLGGSGASLLLYPYFAYFLVQSVGNQAPLRLVPWALHTPAAYFAVVFWPALLAIGLQLLGPRRPGGRAWMVALGWLALLAFTESFYVDDLYGGANERFNTTLKWWPWVYAGVLLTVAAPNLDPFRTGPWRRGVTAASLTAICGCFGLVLARAWWEPLRQPENRKFIGRLDGTGWLRRDPVLGSILDFLKVQPPGVLLESPDERAFCQVGAFAALLGRPEVIGWASHENLWRGNQSDINPRYEQARAFYRGELAEPAAFLEKHRVQLVLWLPRDNPRPEVFNRLNAALAAAGYDWQEFYRADPHVVGVWTRRPPE